MEGKDPQSRKWCFTLNNYSEEELKSSIQILSPRSQYIIGKEVGEEGTPHLQGFFECKSPKKFSMVKRWLGDRAHIEKAKGSLEDNYKYCSKDGDFDSNIDLRTFQQKLDDMILEKEYKDVVWKEWQNNIIELISNDTNGRDIHWIYDKKGNSGKSFLCKWLDIKYDVILASGKAGDVFNQVNMAIAAERIPKVVLMDIPRHNMEYVNYGLIEKLKDGHIYSGKYEGGKARFPWPHVICFSNERPDTDKLSKDRWKVIKLP